MTSNLPVLHGHAPGAALPGFVRPMTNIFNPSAAPLARPFPLLELRGRLHAALLLTDHLVAPGASLVSNPSFFELWRGEPATYAALFRDGRLRPLMAGTEMTFLGAVERRLAKNSTGLDHMNPADVAPFARALDQAEKVTVVVPRADIDRMKADVSRILCASLPEVAPELGSLARDVTYLMEQEVDLGKGLDGSWWGRLASNPAWPQFAGHEAVLRQLGVLVHDTALAAASGSALQGHAYGRQCGALLRYLSAISRSEGGVANEGGVPLDQRDIPAILDFSTLGAISTSDVLRLEADAAAAKRRYIAAAQQHAAAPTIDHVQQLKAAMDDYLLALNVSSKNLFPVIAERVRTARAWKSRLTLLRIAAAAGTGLAAPVAAAVAVADLSAAVLGVDKAILWWAALGTIAVGAPLGYYVQRKIEQAGAAQAQAEADLARMRPAAFTFPLAKDHH